MGKNTCRTKGAEKPCGPCWEALKIDLSIDSISYASYLNTLRVFLADGPALGTQEFSFAWGPSCGAWDGRGSTELSHCHQSRRPLQGGVREWRLLAVTTNSLNLKTTPPMALIEKKKLILIRKKKKKKKIKILSGLLLFDIQTSANYFHSF